MPCSDSSSSMHIVLDKDEKFKSFQYAKITCGQEIGAETGLNGYYTGKTLPEILDVSFQKVIDDLKVEEEEAAFLLYLEWEVLRCGIAMYLGINDPLIDAERCQISAIEQTPDGIEIAEVVLPPKELPKILPCSLKNKGRD